VCVRQDEIHTSRTTRVQRAGSSFTLGCVGGACAAFVRSFVRSGRTRRRREREEDGKRIAQSTTGSDPRSAVHRPCARFRYLSNSTQLGRRSSPTEPSKQKTHPTLYGARMLVSANRDTVQPQVSGVAGRRSRFNGGNPRTVKTFRFRELRSSVGSRCFGACAS
jgi:hypothetical protein